LDGQRFEVKVLKTVKDSRPTIVTSVDDEAAANHVQDSAGSGLELQPHILKASDPTPGPAKRYTALQSCNWHLNRYS